MTLLSKTVTRETAICYRGRALVVTLTPRAVEIREKGRRDRLAISYDAIYECALKLRYRANQRLSKKK
jgi:hypothetical protein